MWLNCWWAAGSSNTRHCELTHLRHHLVRSPPPSGSLSRTPIPRLRRRQSNMARHAPSKTRGPAHSSKPGASHTEPVALGTLTVPQTCPPTSQRQDPRQQARHVHLRAPPSRPPPPTARRPCGVGTNNVPLGGVLGGSCQRDRSSTGRCRDLSRTESAGSTNQRSGVYSERR